MRRSGEGDMIFNWLGKIFCAGCRRRPGENFYFSTPGFAFSRAAKSKSRDNLSTSCSFSHNPPAHPNHKQQSCLTLQNVLGAVVSTDDNNSLFISFSLCLCVRTGGKDFNVVPLGAMKGAPMIKPSCHIFVSDKGDQDVMFPELPQHDAFP
eukprot:scaffold6263_cov192-Alexandrium_tamarense.AAC.18